MKTEELAERVLEERRSMAARRPGVAYYMMNLNHPAVGALYQLWLNEQGPHGMAPSDRARTCFELELMAPAARRLLEQHFETVDRVKTMGNRG